MVRLYEFEAKEILRKYNILVPDGFVINSINELKQNLKNITPPLMLKAQILAGGRGKLGGIKTAESITEVISKAKELLGTKIKDKEVKTILIEKKIKIKNEFYIGITIDTLKQKFVIIFSASGGMEIEELAQKNPEKIKKIYFEPTEFEKIDLKGYFHSLQFSMKLILEIEEFIQRLWQILNDYDLNLIEINPCILSMDGKLYAADARMNIDENSLIRHEEFNMRKREELTETEILVQEKGMSYVELDGNIGIISNGAGLVMSTIDSVRFYGGEPANFLDIGGGATRDRILFALETISSNSKIKGILINIVGGITRCDEIAYGILEFLNFRNDILLVIRLIGTKEKEGRKMLTEHAITVVNTMEEAIIKIIDLVKST